MASFNKVILAGNLTADPEKRYIPSGTAVAELRMAVNERYKNKEGEWVDTPVYVSVEVWDRQAETCCQYLSKGSALLVEGRLKFDQWEDKDSGSKRSKLSVRGERVQFLGSPGGRDGAPAGGGDSAGAPAPVKAPAPPAADEDDDLPF